MKKRLLHDPTAENIKRYIRAIKEAKDRKAADKMKIIDYSSYPELPSSSKESFKAHEEEMKKRLDYHIQKIESDRKRILEKLAKRKNTK